MADAGLVRAAATAQRLIEKKGRSVDLFKVNRTPDVPSQPWLGVTGVPTLPEGGEIMPVTVVFVPPTGSGFGKMIKDIDGGALDVEFEQVALLASNSIVAPATVLDVEEADAMRDGDDIWKIVRKGHLQPGDESIMFWLGLKR